MSRFPSPQQLASYAGLVPVVHASGGKTFYGPFRQSSNHYLRSAFVAAANLIATCQRQKAWAQRHVMRLYLKLRASKGHNKAAVALARHLAESGDLNQSTTLSGASVDCSQVFVRERVSAGSVVALARLCL